MIYVFDVDGTLTPSRQPATEQMVEFLLEWGERHRFYLCSGSDLDKIKEQLPDKFLDMSRGIFGCMGNSFHRKGKEVYMRDFRSPPGLKDDLLRLMKSSKYPVRCGNHIEERMGMWNFSVVGRNATTEERSDYHRWDLEHGEREALAELINEKYNGRVVGTVGGEISIDLTNPEKDKAQVFKEIIKLELIDRKLAFIGDRTLPGGNDHALAKVVADYAYGSVHQTESWEQTIDILNDLEGT